LLGTMSMCEQELLSVKRGREGERETCKDTYKDTYKDRRTVRV
jgi:hypothetical protein